MGSYAELRRASGLAGQMTAVGTNPAELARSINQRYGSPSQPQVVSRQFISKLSTGRVSRCTPTLADRISAVLGVTTDLLFEMRGLPHGTAQNASRSRAA